MQIKQNRAEVTQFSELINDYLLLTSHIFFFLPSLSLMHSQFGVFILEALLLNAELLDIFGHIFLDNLYDGTYKYPRCTMSIATCVFL